MNSKPRGYYEERVTQILGMPVSVVLWTDNKVVNLLSTYVGALPEYSVNRLNKKTKEKVAVSCPAAVREYNTHMGGVDLIDANLARYRITFRSRKWYLKIFYHLLDMVCVNMWLCWKKKDSCNIATLAVFKEEVALSLCKSGFVQQPTRGMRLTEVKRRKKNTIIPSRHVRADRLDHWPVFKNTRQRCKYPTCSLKSDIVCSKCEVSLCCQKGQNCFSDYHTAA